MNAKFGLLAARMNALDANVKAEMDDIRSDVRTQAEDAEKRVKADTQSWLQMNERSMLNTCIAGIVVLVFAVISSIALGAKVTRALESSETASSILAGAMSGEVFAKNVRRAARAARKKRMEPSS